MDDAVVRRLINRNITAPSGRTSMRLEPEMWEAVREICYREDIALSELISRIDQIKAKGGRTSALRVYVLGYFKEAATNEGHAAAGHGALVRRRH